MPQLREELEGGVVMHKIKFSRCPIGRHRGERWEKLEKVDTSKPVVLSRRGYMWSSSLWRAWKEQSVGKGEGFLVRKDTFSDFTFEDWKQLMCTFYNTEDVYGIILYFRQGDYEFTTFRAYDVRKAAYYERCVGEEFMVEEVD